MCLSMVTKPYLCLDVSLSNKVYPTSGLFSPGQSQMVSQYLFESSEKFKVLTSILYYLNMILHICVICIDVYHLYMIYIYMIFIVTGDNTNYY